MATQPFALPVMPAVARILSHYDRAKVEAFVEVAIGLLDTLDGELDAEEDDPTEANGDELDGTGAEDDFCEHSVPRSLQGPGCPLGDPDMAVDDKACDEPFQDCEEEPHLMPTYGVDQSRGPISPWQG